MIWFAHSAAVQQHVGQKLLNTSADVKYAWPSTNSNRHKLAAEGKQGGALHVAYYTHFSLEFVQSLGAAINLTQVTPLVLLSTGAETGAGGRIRDTHATGTGSIMGASTAGYCVGNLQLDKFTHSWEDPSAVYPANLASPLQILIDASNGASDYGNKFGEPLIAGYMRTFGMRVPDGNRREWIKPIMFR